MQYFERANVYICTCITITQWRYCIRLENLGEETVQLRERHWRIFSLSGTLETVRGRGIIGKVDNSLLNFLSFWLFRVLDVIVNKVNSSNSSVPSVLWCCWLEGHPACKNWVVRYWHGYLSGVRYKWFAYGLACHCHIIISCFIEVQNGLPVWC